LQENEALMEALRAAQKRLLQVTRDRTFLLDRLLLHEKVDNSTSESEETDSSDDGEPVKVEPPAKKSSPSLYSNWF
jgi:INO80 complex subunit E